jgi:transcriptional regulator with XRE-family HTH domain
MEGPHEPNRTHHSSLDDMIAKITTPDFSERIKSVLREAEVSLTLVKMRSRCGFTQADIARAIKCDDEVVVGVESGFDRDLTLGMIQAYAKATGCSLNLKVTPRGILVRFDEPSPAPGPAKKPSQ